MPLRSFPACARALLALLPGQLDERLDRGRLWRREARQARRDRLQRLAVANARRGRRMEREQLRGRVFRPGAATQGLEPGEALIAEEIDVGALAARGYGALAAAQRLGEVAVHDVGAGELVDGEASGGRIEEPPLENLGRFDQPRSGGEARRQPACSDR